MIAEKFSSEVKLINKYLESVFLTEDYFSSEKELIESINYSLLSGGKRFRPLLSGLTSKLLGKEFDFAIPYGAAIELIHCYSLIHDDMPAMDNDDVRRGQPSHHIKYGETKSLLAGDALQAYAFSLVAKNYSAASATAMHVLARSAYQMVLGQALDLCSPKEITFDYIQKVHAKKTGALINASVLGVAYLCEAKTDTINALDVFSKKLGIAFQVADDIQDFNEGKKEPINCVNYLGIEKSLELLASVSKECEESLVSFGSQADDFKFLIGYNQSRI